MRSRAWLCLRDRRNANAGFVQHRVAAPYVEVYSDAELAADAIHQLRVAGDMPRLAFTAEAVSFGPLAHGSVPRLEAMIRGLVATLDHFHVASVRELLGFPVASLDRRTLCGHRPLPATPDRFVISTLRWTACKRCLARSKKP